MKEKVESKVVMTLTWRPSWAPLRRDDGHVVGQPSHPVIGNGVHQPVASEIKIERDPENAVEVRRSAGVDVVVERLLSVAKMIWM